jgi:hypothetical protein
MFNWLLVNLSVHVILVCEHHVGSEVLTAVVMESSIFWDITPCSPLKVRARLCLPPAFTPVSCLAYSSTLKMEAKCSSETSVDFQRTTRSYIPEYRTLYMNIPFYAFFPQSELNYCLSDPSHVSSPKIFYWSWENLVRCTVQLFGQRHYPTIRKVTDSNPDEIIGFFNWPNHSTRTVALGPTQPLTEMSTRNFPGCKGRPARGADNLTAICEPIV